ncbi:MAG: DNA repair protein RecO [Candidatus Delongbacteria bacterium]|nr:DNA repair protein RecO [Candidatus Delongbacteria bacterium]
MTGSKIIFTTGIILKNSRHKDTSAVISALTPDLGMIEFPKFGYNSKKNSSKSDLQAVNLVDLKLEQHGKNLKLTDCSIIESYDNLRKSYNKTQTALSIFKTLLFSNLYDDKDYRLIFHLTRKLLESLDNSDPCPVTTAIYFYYQLAWCLGISFSFRDNEDAQNCYLQSENGLFFCRNKPLESGSAYGVSKALYDRLSQFHSIKFAQIHKLDYITLKEYAEFREMYRIYTGYHLNQPVHIAGLEISEV